MAVTFDEDGALARWFRRRTEDLAQARQERDQRAWQALSEPAADVAQAPALVRMTHCEGPATYTAVDDKQAQGMGALYSEHGRYSIRGGTPGTVAVQPGFLGLNKAKLRQYGGQIAISPQDGGRVADTRGPSGPYSVSDIGDANVRGTPGVAFDIYRWPDNRSARRFGRVRFPTTISFPADIGAACPAGWTTR